MRHSAIFLAATCLFASSLAAAPLVPSDQTILDMTEYETVTSCEAALGKMRELCAGVRFNSLETVQAAHADVDGNGHVDLVVRRFTRQECSSQGCLTRVYLSDGQNYRPATPTVIAAGVISQCATATGRGLNLAHRSDGECQSFK